MRSFFLEERSIRFCHLCNKDYYLRQCFICANYICSECFFSFNRVENSLPELMNSDMIIDNSELVKIQNTFESHEEICDDYVYNDNTGRINNLPEWNLHKDLTCYDCFMKYKNKSRRYTSGSYNNYVVSYEVFSSLYHDIVDSIYEIENPVLKSVLLKITCELGLIEITSPNYLCYSVYPDHHILNNMDFFNLHEKLITKTINVNDVIYCVHHLNKSPTSKSNINFIEFCAFILLTESYFNATKRHSIEGMKLAPWSRKFTYSTYPNNLLICIDQESLVNNNSYSSEAKCKNWMKINLHESVINNTLIWNNECSQYCHDMKKRLFVETSDKFYFISKKHEHTY